MARLRHGRGLLGRFATDDNGNIAMLFAAFMTLGTVLGAFAVDEGSLYLQRRQDQSAVDLAAITAAQDPAHAFERARAALVEAGLVPADASQTLLASGNGVVTLKVDTGSYFADSTLAVDARFAAGAAPPNAVHIVYRQRGTLFFAQSWMAPPSIGVEALASATPTVAFSVGSTLASLKDGLPNLLLNNLLGASVSLDALSYNGLANAQVNLFSFLDGLAQQLNIKAGTYDDLLAASADEGSIAKALAGALNGADAGAATLLGQTLGHNGKIPLGKLFDLGSAGRLDIGTGAQSGYVAGVSALEILTAGAALSDGTHQVAVNLAGTIPGLVGLTLNLAVGEPQQFASWFALGPSGTIARTAQVRLQFVATIGGGLSLPGISIRLPVYLDLAYAEAGVAAAACPTAGQPTGSATIWARPGVARLILGEATPAQLADFSRNPSIGTAKLIDALLLKVSGSGEADLSQMAPAALSFSAADIANGTIKRVKTTQMAQSLAASLLSNLTLNVSLLGLGLSSNAVRGLVAGLIAPLAPVLDATIDTTLQTLGLSLGVADVRVYGVNCGRSVLVG